MIQRICSAAKWLMVSLLLISASGCTQTLARAQPRPAVVSRFRCRPISRNAKKMSTGTTCDTSVWPVLGPITPGGPEVAMDPPSEDEVMRALEKARPVQGGIPWLHEVQRNHVRIVSELMSPIISIRRG